MPERRVVLVEYFTTDTAAYLFGVRSDFDEPDIVEVRLDQNQLLDFTKKHFGTGNRVRMLIEDEEESWHKYDSLIEPISRWANPEDVICLIPHGPLHRLPFHTLKLEGQYLIERNPVIYNPSASVLKFCQDKRGRNIISANNRPKVAVFGDSLHDLDYARAEAKELGEFFGVKPLLDVEVTREAFQQNIAGKDIVHFAGHAKFEETKPLESGLFLAGNDVLKAHEIFELKDLHAYLVALSGCETGINERHPGDELIGLTRAFLYAGTSSLLVSLWTVADNSAAFLMVQFYRYLREQPTMLKVDALRNAMLDTKENKDNSDWMSFYHWAPFILIGDWR